MRCMIAFPMPAGSLPYSFTAILMAYHLACRSQCKHDTTFKWNPVCKRWQMTPILLKHLHQCLQVKRAIGWLRVRDRERELQVESKLAACLILKEMAQNSPAVFNVHVKGFIDVIWNSLRHPSREIREAAVQALSVSLQTNLVK